MSTQHTPGPWNYRKPSEDVPNVFYWIDGANGAPLADVKWHEQGAALADARLIAAAPDLLAALKLLQFLASGRSAAGKSGLTVNQLNEVMAAANAALAKARG